MKEQEERIQYEIVEWFRNTYCRIGCNPRNCIFSVPNDGKNVMEQMRKKSTGMMAGVSDLVVLLPNRCIFVEVKTATGTQSDKQKDFEAQVVELGFDYIVVRSLNDFRTALQTM